MSRFTFIMPIYKAQYFKEALNSILGQSYRDYNVIISDDCSPEGVEQISKGFLSDPRVTYRRNPSNMGAARLAEHWNLLLDLCDSEYVIVASDDDIYDMRFLEKVNEMTQKHPEVDLIHTRARIIDENGTPGKEDQPMKELMSFDEHINHFINPDSVLCIGNYVFRTAALKKAGGFANLPLAWKSDSATAIELSRNGVACTSDVLFSFRMSGINISTLPHGNHALDKTKTEATLDFYSLYIIPLGLQPATLGGFKKKLGGEIRSYYQSFSMKEFLILLIRMNRLKLFASIRNKLSFIIFWVKSH